MKYADYEKLPGAEPNFAVQPDRMVWVVTVQADVWTRATLVHGPVLKHAYSVVIDAETGMVSDFCIGCSFVSTDTPGPSATSSTGMYTRHQQEGRR